MMRESVGNLYQINRSVSTHRLTMAFTWGQNRSEAASRHKGAASSFMLGQ